MFMVKLTGIRLLTHPPLLCTCQGDVYFPPLEADSVLKSEQFDLHWFLRCPGSQSSLVSILVTLPHNMI